MPSEGKNKFIDELRESKEALSRSAYAMLEQRIQQLERHREQLEWLLEKTLSSRSWRITAPLRSVVHYIHALWPLYTKRKTTFEPQVGNNLIEIAPKRFQVLGPGATVVLLKSLSDLGRPRFVTGACLCEVVLGGQTKKIQGYLSYDRGGGFLAGEREFVSLDTQPQHVFLPPDTKAIRFEPFLDIGSFDLHSLTLHKLGSIRRLTMYLESRKKKPRPRVFLARLGKALLVLRQGGLSALKMRMLSFERQDNYHEWVRRYDLLQSADFAAMKRHQAQFVYAPKFSIVMPVCDPDERWLRRAIDSVLMQVYQNFELCIADDASEKASVRALLHEYQTQDARVKVQFRRERGHIAAATNSALTNADGDYVIFLDHDDELAPHALYCFAERLQAGSEGTPRARLLYSDEDKISETGQRFSPYFKTDFDAELLRAQNYINHCLCVERALVAKLGGLRSAIGNNPVDGAQDWDLVLRVTALIERPEISHIPQILYHWRAASTSTASSYATKPYVLEAQRTVVAEYLQQRHVPVKAVSILNLISHVSASYDLPHKPSLSFIVLDEKDAAAKSGVVSAANQIDLGMESQRLAAALDTAAEINKCITAATGDVIIVLKKSIEIKDAASLDELLALALAPKNGVVAPKALDKRRLILQSGILLGRHPLFEPSANGKPEHDVGYFKRLMLRHSASAIAGGCLVIRKELFQRYGPFDETLPYELAQIDFCLRLLDGGYENVITPFANVRDLVTTASAASPFSAEDGTRLAERWAKYFNMDPFYNANLSLSGEAYSLSFPPRAARPWLVR